MSRRFTGEYAADGKARRLAAREAAGHRCVRCGHPFESGKHGKGEWSPCDEKCTHDGPLRIVLAGKEVVKVIPILSAGFVAADLVAIHSDSVVEAQWRILTVHHLDGDKANDAWWNTLALCQRCHLQIQTLVDPRIPYFLEHSAWFKPFVAGFYARKYEGRDITRDEAMRRLDELLAHECMEATP